MIITYGMGFIGKTFLVFAFVEESTFRICGRNGCFLFFRRLIVVIVERLFAMFFTVFIDFCEELFSITFGLLWYHFLSFFLCVGTGFNMSAVNKYCLCIEIAFFGSSVQYPTKDIFDRFL